MRRGVMQKLSGPSLVSALVLIMGTVLGVHGISAVAAEAVVKAPTPPAALKQAIELAAAATVKAFDAADADALAAMFVAEGELVDEDGTVFTGRDEVKELFERFFKQFAGATLELEVVEVRPLGDGLAVEEGLRRITTADHSAAQMRYAAVRVREGEAWPIASYREFADDPDPTPRELLAPLDWLVGEWVDESPEGRTTIRYDWSEDGNFLIGDYMLAVAGRPVGKTIQRIGWDPVAEAVRSWTFDPDGGFSHGFWVPAEDGWVVRSEATMPDGTTGTATVMMRVRDADHFIVESTNRIVGGMAEPDFKLVIARRPPPPAAVGK